MEKALLRKSILIVAIFFTLGVITALFFFHKSSVQNIAEEKVIVPTTFNKETPNVDTSSWKTFSDKQLTLSMKYPSTVMLDSRQTSQGRMDVFIFTEDKAKQLPGKVPVLYIANTHKVGLDGFSAFRKGDCKQPCTISYKTTQWININNAYGIRNPLTGDVDNYYLTDKNQKGTVLNVYIGGYTGGYTNKESKDTKKKMDTFEQMIRTIQL